jgi:hypothetical protein
VAHWNRRELRMADDHGWRCKPGYSIFVADRGAVRFDIPSSWVVQVDDAGVRIHDKSPPDDDVRIQLTVFYPAPLVDLPQMPIGTLLADALAERDDDEAAGELLGIDPVSLVLRPGLEIAWTEVRRIDPEGKREARHRHLFARGKGTDRGYEREILPFITMDFWPEDAGRCKPVWKELLRSLRVGQYVADPRQGPQRR